MTLKILIIDPSGNFEEGKGTTGWAYYDNKDLISVGQIRAEEHHSQIEYWKKQINIFRSLNPDIVVIESYRLFGNTAQAQVGSELETPQLIGIIKYEMNDKDVVIQDPSTKSRFSNELLLKKNVISQNSKRRYHATGVPISQHILDAIKHGEYYVNFKLNKKEKK